MDEKLKLKEMIEQSDNIVFFGGAGVSTRSGIPDFRSEDGLYKQKYSYPPETILSNEFFRYQTSEFFRFYFDKMIYLDAKPNEAHLALAKLEAMGKLKAIVTQNIDNLHQMAGSKTVYELHGSVYRNYCTGCKKFYTINDMLERRNPIPYCECGKVIKPDVVLYGESLDEQTIQNSIDAISAADVLIIGGTSLNVYPAAGLVRYYNKDKLVLINKSVTPYDSCANLIINDDIADTLGFCVV